MTGGISLVPSKRLTGDIALMYLSRVMSIKKRKRKTKTVYQVRVQVEGHRKSKVFRKYQDAKMWQENIQLDRRVIDYANITFAQAAQMWIESNAGIY
jgi:hypothetical protein